MSSYDALDYACRTAYPRSSCMDTGPLSREGSHHAHAWVLNTGSRPSSGRPGSAAALQPTLQRKQSMLGPGFGDAGCASLPPSSIVVPTTTASTGCSGNSTNGNFTRGSFSSWSRGADPRKPLPHGVAHGIDGPRMAVHGGGCDAARPLSPYMPRPRPLTATGFVSQHSGAVALVHACRHLHAESMVRHRDREALAEEWHQLLCAMDPQHPGYVTTPIAEGLDAFTLAYAILLIKERNAGSGFDASDFPDKVSGGRCCHAARRVDESLLNELMVGAIRQMKQRGKRRPISAAPIVGMSPVNRQHLLVHVYGGGHRRPKARPPSCRSQLHYSYNLDRFLEYLSGQEKEGGPASVSSQAEADLPPSSPPPTPPPSPKAPVAAPKPRRVARKESVIAEPPAPPAALVVVQEDFVTEVAAPALKPKPELKQAAIQTDVVVEPRKKKVKEKVPADVAVVVAAVELSHAGSQWEPPRRRVEPKPELKQAAVQTDVVVEPRKKKVKKKVPADVAVMVAAVELSHAGSQWEPPRRRVEPKPELKQAAVQTDVVVELRKKKVKKKVPADVAVVVAAVELSHAGSQWEPPRRRADVSEAFPDVDPAVLALYVASAETALRQLSQLAEVDGAEEARSAQDDAEALAAAAAVATAAGTRRLSQSGADGVSCADSRRWLTELLSALDRVDRRIHRRLAGAVLRDVSGFDLIHGDSEAAGSCGRGAAAGSSGGEAAVLTSGMVWAGEGAELGVDVGHAEHTADAQDAAGTGVLFGGLSTGYEQDGPLSGSGLPSIVPVLSGLQAAVASLVRGLLAATAAALALEVEAGDASPAAAGGPRPLTGALRAAGAAVTEILRLLQVLGGMAEVGSSMLTARPRQEEDAGSAAADLMRRLAEAAKALPAILMEHLGPSLGAALTTLAEAWSSPGNILGRCEGSAMDAVRQLFDQLHGCGRDVLLSMGGVCGAAKAGAATLGLAGDALKVTTMDTLSEMAAKLMALVDALDILYGTMPEEEGRQEGGEAEAEAEEVAEADEAEVEGHAEEAGEAEGAGEAEEVGDAEEAEESGEAEEAAQAEAEARDAVQPPVRQPDATLRHVSAAHSFSFPEPEGTAENRRPASAAAVLTGMEVQQEEGQQKEDQQKEGQQKEVQRKEVQQEGQQMAGQQEEGQQKQVQQEEGQQKEGQQYIQEVMSAVGPTTGVAAAGPQRIGSAAVSERLARESDPELAHAGFDAAAGWTQPDGGGAAGDVREPEQAPGREAAAGPQQAGEGAAAASVAQGSGLERAQAQVEKLLVEVQGALNEDMSQADMLHVQSVMSCISGDDMAQAWEASITAMETTTLVADLSLSHEEVSAYARYLGMDPVADARLMYLARNALLAPVPDWCSVHLDGDGFEYFCDSRTQATSYEHPQDVYFVRMYHQEKARQWEREQRGGTAPAAAPAPAPAPVASSQKRPAATAAAAAALQLAQFRSRGPAGKAANPMFNVKQFAAAYEQQQGGGSGGKLAAGGGAAGSGGVAVGDAGPRSSKANQRRAVALKVASEIEMLGDSVAAPTGAPAGPDLRLAGLSGQHVELSRPGSSKSPPAHTTSAHSEITPEVAME